MLIILAFAASRPRARRISRLLATERAPVGTGLSGSTDAVCVVAGGSPDAKVRGASGRGLLGRDSRQRGVLALGLVVGALGKPCASAQTGRVMLKPEFFMFSARARGSFAACFFSASKLFETLRKFTRFAAAGPCRSRFACQVSRAYSSSFLLLLQIFISFLHVDFDTDNSPAQNSSDVRAGCTLWTAVCRRTKSSE